MVDVHNCGPSGRDVEWTHVVCKDMGMCDFGIATLPLDVELLPLQNHARVCREFEVDGVRARVAAGGDLG